MKRFSNQSLYFSTDQLPERDRFPAFCEEMFRRMLMLDITNSDDDPFRGSLEVCQAGAIEIAEISITSADCFRTSGLVRDAKDSLFVVLPRQGLLFTTQGHGVRQIAPGAIAVCDSTEVGGLRTKTASKYIALQVPRKLVTDLVPQIDRFGGIQSEPNIPAVHLLMGYLALISDEFIGDGEAASLFGRHLIDLVGLAFGANGDQRELIEHRTVQSVRREAIYREIERMIDDPALNASAVASSLGITPRYVHLLLEEAGRTFSRHVLERRLSNVYGRLRNPRYAASRISEIAYEAGFVDLSHFNRSFRLRFGMTPSDVRASAATRAR